MALQGRAKLCRPQPDLKFIPPLVEDLLGILGEPHGRYSFLNFATRAEVHWVQGSESPEDLVGPVLRLDIWPTVHVPPGWVRIGPHQQLKALQQTVIALLSLGGLVDVGRERPGLDAAQDGEAQGRYVQRSSTDWVHIKATRTVPGLQVERAVPFASLLVQVPEPAGEFVPVDQDPLGIL